MTVNFGSSGERSGNVPAHNHKKGKQKMKNQDMRIALPESYRAYASRKDVMTAVDHVLSCNGRKKLEARQDWGWEKLPEFHTAVLAAHQVRCDYAILLHELWDMVWRTAMQSVGSNLAPLSIAEAHDYDGTAGLYGCYSIWENWEFGRYVRRKGRRFWLSVCLDRTEASLWLWAGKGEFKQDVKTLKAAIPTKGWKSEPEKYNGYSYVRTRKGIAPIRNGDLELSCLVAAAERALTKLAGQKT